MTPSETNKLFKIFCLIGFAVPMVFTTVLITLEHHNSELFEGFRPMVGVVRCSISSGKVKFYLWTVPSLIILAGSLILVIMSIKIYYTTLARSSSGYTRLDAEMNWFVLSYS
jgi:hypothetical protein